jgi:fibronectin type 3 domain-containing protein
LVVGQTTLPPDDSALSARLSGLGYSVTIKTGTSLVAGDATGKAVVVVSSSADSGTLGSKLTNVTVPVVSLEGYIFDDLKMTGATLNVDYGQVTTPTMLEVRDDQQALSAGLRGTNQNGVWDHLVQPSSAGGRYWGVPSPSAVGLDGRPVTLQGQPGRASVFGYEAGAAMVGLTAPARRVGFFADQAAVRAFTAEGWRLFDAAVEWAAAPVTDAPMARALAAGPSPNRVDLRWVGNDISGIQHDILRAARPGGPYTKIATSSAAGTSPYNGMAIYDYADTTAVTGQTYYYVVSPLLAGRNGRSSREVPAALGLPEAPWVVIYYLVDVDGGLVNTEVVSYAPNATNLRISRSDSSTGPFTEIATIVNGSPLGNVYDDATTLANRTYYYKVQGFNGFGDGPTSVPTPALYDGLSQAAPVQNLYARSLPGGARLNWDHVPRASDYRVVAVGVNDNQLAFAGDLTQPDATLWLPAGQDYNVLVEPGGSWAQSSPPYATVVTVTPGVGSALLVVGETPLRAGEQRLVTELQALGLSVTSKRSVDLVTSDANDRDLVVVSSSAIAAQVGTKLTSVAAPVLVLEPYVLGQMQMTGATAGTHFGVSGNQDSLLIDVEHALGGGATRTTKVSTRLGDFGWGIPASSAIGVGRLPGVVPATGAQPRSLFAFEKGATLANGSVAAARRVAMLVDADVLSGLTDDARLVLQSAVRWAIDPNAQDPREPTNVNAQQSGSNVNLTWSAVPGAASYVVYRANMAFNLPPNDRPRIADIIATGVTSTSFVDNSPLLGAPYSYYVAAVGASGGSDRSAPFYAGVNVAPGRPQIGSAALNGAVRIDMKAGPTTQALSVLRATQSGGPYTAIATNLPATTTSYTAGGLTNGVPAYFAVEAVNASGVSRSLETYGIPRPDLVAPGGLSATASNGQVSLGWGAVANAVAYRVGRGDSASVAPSEIIAASSTLTAVIDGSVANGKSYRYFITPLGDAELTGPTVSFTVSPRGKVLFVRAATASAGDVVLRDRLVALGFDVTEKADNLLVTADANGQDLVVVTETVTSGNIGTKLTNVAVPVLSLEPSILDDLRMTGLSSGTDFGTTAGQTQVNVVDPSLPLAGRLLSGTRTANTSGGVYLWGVPGSEALVAARLLSSSTRAVSFGYQPSAPMVGLAAPARRTALFVDSVAAGSFTADGRALFDAAVSWTAGLR